MGANKERYTAQMHEDLVDTWKESHVCKECGTTFEETHEKDNTPGFRSKDVWVTTNCNCKKNSK